VALALVALAILAFAVRQFAGSDPKAMTAREVRRLLTEVRRAEDRSGSIRAFFQGLRYSSSPFQRSLARMFAGEEDADSRAREDLAALGAEAVPFLLPFLTNDPSPAVRTAVADALGWAGGSQALAALTNAFGRETNAGVAETLVAALQQIEDPAVAPLLLSALQRKDGNPSVRAAVARALGGLKPPEGLAALLTLFDKESSAAVRSGIVEGLGAWDDPRAGALLLKAVREDADQAVRRAAADSLGGLRLPDTAGVLASVLQNEPDENVASSLVRALDQIGGPVAQAALLDAVAAGSDSVRQAAAEALGRFEGTNVLAALAKALADDPQSSVREAAARSLGQMHDPFASPALVDALRKDAAGRVRVVVADSLGQLSATQAVPQLTAIFRDDPDPAARAAAARAWATLRPAESLPGILASCETNAALREKLTESLGFIGHGGAVPLLLRALKEEDSGLRRDAAKALGEIGNAQAVPSLARLLSGDPEEDVRESAALALGLLGSPLAVPALEAALKDRAEEVATEAAWALGHIGDKRAVPALATALTRKWSRLRFPAAFALVEIGDPAAKPALEARLADGDARARLAVSCSLAFFGDGRGMTNLARALNSREDWERFAGIIALLRLNTPDARALLAKARADTDPALRRLAARGIEAGANAALVDTLRGKPGRSGGFGDHRLYAARALVLYNDPAALPALQAAAADPVPELRSVARLAVRHLEKRMPRPEN